MAGPGRAENVGDCCCGIVLLARGRSIWFSTAQEVQSAQSREEHPRAQPAEREPSASGAFLVPSEHR